MEGIVFTSLHFSGDTCIIYTAEKQKKMNPVTKKPKKSETSKLHYTLGWLDW